MGTKEAGILPMKNDITLGISKKRPTRYLSMVLLRNGVDTVITQNCIIYATGGLVQVTTPLWATELLHAFYDGGLEGRA